MYKFAIIDDQIVDQEKMKKAIQEHCQYHHISYTIDLYTNPLEYSYDKPYDAVFLDIDMPEMSGITLARRINQKNPTRIILMSQYDEYMHSTFHVRPFHFIRKHSLRNDSILVLALLFKELQSHQISVKTKRGEQNIMIDDIFYISIENNLASLHTFDESYDIWESLSSLYQKLKPFYFEKTSRSSLVNMKYIEDIQKDKVILTNHVELLLSTRLKTPLKKSYNKYLSENKKT